MFKLILGGLFLLVVGFSLGKMSNPAKVTTTEIVKEESHEGSKKKSATLATKTTTTNAALGTSTTTETLLSFEDSSTQLDSKKLLETKQEVINTLFGAYAGVGVPLDQWTKPFYSFIITYKIFAISLETDFKQDHRIAGHIGLLF